jgi:hypothetical protein
MSNKKDVTIGDVSSSGASDVSVKKGDVVKNDIGQKDMGISDKLKAVTDTVIKKVKSVVGDAVGKIMEATRSIFKR